MQQRESESLNEMIIRLRTYAWNLHIMLLSGKKESYVPSHKGCKEKFLSNYEKEVIGKEIDYTEQIINILKSINL